MAIMGLFNFTQHVKKNSLESFPYYYENYKTEERVEVEEDVFAFMKKLFIHIPEAQFKMIRYYGIYATCHHHHKEKIKKEIILTQYTILLI